MRSKLAILSASIALSWLGHGAHCDAETSGEKPRRARPPEWSADVLDVFVSDPKSLLQGDRPNYELLAKRASGADIQSTSPERVVAAGSSSATKWSDLIDAGTVETEIKRLAREVTREVTNPSSFKGGGYKQCRHHFSMLAVLWAIAAEYEETIRWQDTAAGLRDQFARAGFNCKTGTDQTFREATQRKQDLADLIRGSRPQTPEAMPETIWNEVTDRPPLMQRLKVAHQDRLSKWLATKRDFNRNREDLQHEAQLVALLGEIIKQKGFDYWDDDDYVAHADDLSQAGQALAAAAQERNYDAARAAITNVTKSCSECHDGYRG